MDFFILWSMFVLIELTATISPGPAFAITMRNAVSGNRSDGILTSIGLGLGLSIHVLLAVLGISIFITQTPLLYDVVKYSGALYLVYIGIKSIMVKKNDNKSYAKIDGEIRNKSKWRRIQNGFLTNVLNPKALVFCTAIYAQFITPETPMWMAAIFLITAITIEILWFSIVTIFLTTPKIRQRFLHISHWIERISGGLLIGLGVKLALSKT